VSVGARVVAQRGRVGGAGGEEGDGVVDEEEGPLPRASLVMVGVLLPVLLPVLFLVGPQAPEQPVRRQLLLLLMQLQALLVSR
jgi:hypothetical protein